MNEILNNPYINPENSWIDDSVPEHEHDFSLRYTATIQGDSRVSIGASYYSVDKCSKCNSFIHAVYTRFPTSKQLLFKRPILATGFKRATFIKEIDGTT